MLQSPKVIPVACGASANGRDAHNLPCGRREVQGGKEIQNRGIRIHPNAIGPFFALPYLLSELDGLQEIISANPENEDPESERAIQISDFR